MKLAKRAGSGLHHRAFAYNKPNKFTDLKITSSLKRADASFIAQLRVGQCRTIGAFYHILNPNTDPHLSPADHFKTSCRWCHQASETVHHVFHLCKDARIVSLRNELDLPKPYTRILGSPQSTSSGGFISQGGHFSCCRMKTKQDTNQIINNRKTLEVQYQ